MTQIPEHMKKTTDMFLADIRKAFGDSLRTVILYGPAARGEQHKNRLHINFMVIVDDNTPSELARCARHIKNWHKELITTPLFLEPGFIEQSLDTYPLEFLDMKTSYAVVYGDDVLEGISFEPSDVRNQCEREIKGKLLHLRAEYLALRGNQKALTDLITRSIETFRLVFAGALFIKGRDIPAGTGLLLDAVTAEYGLDASLFRTLTGIAHGDIKAGEAETDEIFDLYVEELDKLSNAINSMTGEPENNSGNMGT
ncbi:hypothetical protein LLG96_01570 [bacterium]|nr:hypothetical protein [bacterium]